MYTALMNHSYNGKILFVEVFKQIMPYLFEDNLTFDKFYLQKADKFYLQKVKTHFKYQH